MIFGIGHDVVEVKRIEKLYAKYKESFLDKILSKEEQLIYQEQKKTIHYLAKRFAAKEAFAKACGTGFRDIITLPGITVINDELGKPTFNFNLKIKEWLLDKKIHGIHVSISDETNIASAFVILEKED